MSLNSVRKATCGVHGCRGLVAAIPNTYIML